MLEQQMEDEVSLKRRIADFKKALSKNGVLEEFDRGIFESIIEKVIVGGYDEDGNKDPYKITFIYKTGFRNEIGNAKERFDKSKGIGDKAKELCSHIVDEVKDVCSYVSDNTRRVSNNDAACGKMKNLALKTTTSCGLRAKIGEKSNQFLPSFFAQFYRCKCLSNDDHGVKIALRQNLEKK